jgi:hypothetical protein
MNTFPVLIFSKTYTVYHADRVYDTKSHDQGFLVAVSAAVSVVKYT